MVTWEDLKISFLNNAFYYSKSFYNLHHLITDRFKVQDFTIDYLKIYKSNEIETLNSSLELMKFANILKENIEIVEIKYYYNNTAFIVMYNNIKELDYQPNINCNDDSMTFKYKIISAILKSDVLSTINDILSDLVDNVTIDGATIGHTSDTDLMTLASGVLTVAGEISVTTLDIGGTNVGSTAAELNLLDGSAKSTSSITLADSDAFIVIDGTTTKQIPASDIKTYAGAGITIKEESSTLSTDATTLKFVGDTVTATGSGVEKTITITDESLINAIIFG